MPIQLKMKNNYVLIKDLIMERKTAAGIILPPPKVNRNAVVLESYENSEVSKGDVIIKNVGKGTPMVLNDMKCEMIHINDIIAIIKEDK